MRKRRRETDTSIEVFVAVGHTFGTVLGTGYIKESGARRFCSTVLARGTLCEA